MVCFVYCVCVFGFGIDSLMIVLVLLIGVDCFFVFTFVGILFVAWNLTHLIWLLVGLWYLLFLCVL